MNPILRFLLRRPAETDAFVDAPADVSTPVQPWFYGQTRDAPDRLPRFKGSGGGGRGQRKESAEVGRARAKLREAFTPSQPVTDRRLFAGRQQVLGQLIEAVEDRLAHVVVFGERGIGKTSLLHIVATLAEESDYLTLRATCGAGTSFEVLFRNLLREVPALYHRSVSPTDAGGETATTLAELLPAYSFDARELADLLSGVQSCHILVILDEYDRIENEAFRISVAELIKNLSDRAAPVQLVIAGVSSNLHELIGYIPSIRRNVVGLPLPKLSQDEVGEIVQLGERTCGLAFNGDALALIEHIAEGSPYLVRLACYHSSLVALEHGRTAIVRSDIQEALDHMVEEAAARLSHGVLQRVGRLGVQDDAYLPALVHLAGTPSGWFSALDIAEQAGDETERRGLETLIHDRLVPHGLLACEGEGADRRYRFVDEGLQSYLWISIARRRIAAP